MTGREFSPNEKKGWMLLCLIGAIAMFLIGIWCIRYHLSVIPSVYGSLVLFFGIISIAASLLLLIFRSAVAHDWDTTWSITELFKNV